MVDPVGFKPASLSARLTPVTPAAPVRAPEAATQAAQTSTAAALTQTASQSAPVDAERVARIKRAIAEGKFPLVPSTVADRLLALKLQWNPHDKA
jgi:negative regulator of flagellin synthesis FlgM